jgi:hypothetical protein
MEDNTTREGPDILNNVHGKEKRKLKKKLKRKENRIQEALHKVKEEDPTKQLDEEQRRLQQQDEALLQLELYKWEE